MYTFNQNLILPTLLGLVTLTWHSASQANNEIPQNESEPRTITVTASESQFGQVISNSEPLQDEKTAASVAISEVTTSASKTSKKMAAADTKSIKQTTTGYRKQDVANSDFWFYDTWLTLYSDVDYDGYYYSFSVEFDVDTVYNFADVYAVVYLGTDDYYDAIHVTSDFSIYADDSADSFIVDVDLLTGFKPNDYDVLIELFDANTHELLAYTDGYYDADLAYVPLESESYETTYVEEQVVVVTEHGGSLSWFALLGLGLVGGWRIFKRYQ